MNETLRSYARRFFNMHTTIANITDENIICCFQNRLFSKHTYHNFGHNRPTTAVELRDMMARWADLEDEKNGRFPSVTTTSKASATTISTKASGTTQGTPESVSQTKKSRPLSAIRVARSQGTTTCNTSKS
jgi:hypothetical protein